MRKRCAWRCVSEVSEATYKRLWPERMLRPAAVRLKTYSGSPLTVLGQLQVKGKYQDQTANSPIFVIAGDGPSLLGRDWLYHLKQDSKRICHVETKALEDILLKHTPIFQELRPGDTERTQSHPACRYKCKPCVQQA